MSRRARLCPPGARVALFVEGGDEERLCQTVLGPRPVFYKTLNGHDPIATEREVFAAINDPNWPSILHVGVLLDAEEDPKSSRQLAEQIFHQLGISIPPNPGKIHEGAGQRTGFYLLPDNRSKGSIESLLRQAADPATSACVDAFFTCAPNPGLTTAQRDKAWVSAYASARTGNGRLDQLFGEQPAFDAEHSALDPLRAFLRALVG